MHMDLIGITVHLRMLSMIQISSEGSENIFIMIWREKLTMLIDGW